MKCGTNHQTWLERMPTGYMPRSCNQTRIATIQQLRKSRTSLPIAILYTTRPSSGLCCTLKLDKSGNEPPPSPMTVPMMNLARYA